MNEADRIFNSVIRPDRPIGRTIRSTKTAAQQRYEDMQATKAEKAYASYMSNGKGGTLVYAAVGSPPVTIETVTYDAVCEFCDHVVYAGLADQKIYMPSVMKQWARNQYGECRQLQTVHEFIDRWEQEQINNFS